MSCPRILTVIVADDSPFVHQMEPIRHRTVHVKLTEGQVAEIGLRCTGQVGNQRTYETISKCYLEDEPRKNYGE